MTVERKESREARKEHESAANIAGVMATGIRSRAQDELAQMPIDVGAVRTVAEFLDRVADAIDPGLDEREMEYAEIEEEAVEEEGIEEEEKPSVDDDLFEKFKAFMKREKEE